MRPTTHNYNGHVNHEIALGRDASVRRGRRLEYITLAWNSGEAIAALIAGFLAGSVALVGFGLDSVIAGDGGMGSGNPDQQGRTGLACACSGGPGSGGAGCVIVLAGLVALRRRRLSW